MRIQEDQLKLLSHYKIKKKMISYHKFNEKKQLTNIIKYFNEGKILSLISDAGTPLLSDPGRLLVNECVENSIKSNTNTRCILNNFSFECFRF